MKKACLLTISLVLALGAGALWAAVEVPDRARSHYDAGMAAKRAHDLQRAAQRFEWALALAPDWPDAHWALAWTRLGLGDNEQAAREFSRVIVLAPNSEMARKAEAALSALPAKPAAAAGPVVVPHHPPGIAWHDSWDEALAAAGASGRPILASVYTPGAAPAKEFAEKTLTAPEVVEASKEFECVRINSQEGVPWPEAGATSDPTPVVVSRPDGSPVYATFGVLEPEKLLFHLGEAKRYRKMEADAPALEARQAANPGDLETCFELGRWYLMKGGADLGGMLSGLGLSAEGMAEAMAGMMAAGGTPATAGPSTEQGAPSALAGGLWIGFEQDKTKAAELRAKGTALVRQVREQDPADGLGHAAEIDFLLMESALVEEKLPEAAEMARHYLDAYPEGKGGVLSYLVLALASLTPQEGSNAPPDLTEAKGFLDKAMEAPGDEETRMMAAMFRVILEFMEGMIKGLGEMGNELQGTPPGP